MTITEFCNEINNYFKIEKYIGEIQISNGNIVGFDEKLKQNQYFRIVGSVFNDGVYKYPATNLVEEDFNGAVWAMAVPPSALALFEKMKAWDDKYGSSEAANSPFQSESFGGYSYSKGYNSSQSGGDSTVSWKRQFRNDLNQYRKI